MIDKTVAGIMAHQVAVFRRLSQVLRRHTSRSRVLAAISVFLHRISGRLSDFALERLSAQLNRMQVHLKAVQLDQPKKSHPWV